MAKTFAISADCTVRIWCSGTPEDFHVINGGWSGSLRNGKLYIKGNKVESYYAKVIWEGYVPRIHARDYNSAIAWIQRQVDLGVLFSGEPPAVQEYEDRDLIPY